MVAHCGATVHAATAGSPSAAAASTTPNQLDRWRSELENYGRVGAKVQGSQWMMQWVRSGRMARLTWKVQRSERTASVSLIDGHVLDGWGRERSRGG